jgi:nitrous oxide reductase accessory protein NosL
MKKLTQLLAALLLIIFVAGTSYSQDTENPLLIVSSQKVKLADMGTVSSMVNEKMGPILNSLVDDGFLFSWGSFNHTWGDEWNMNIWYVTKDMSSFDSFWSEYMKRVDEQQKETWAKMVDYIQEHKDNIYTITNQYPAPPQK